MEKNKKGISEKIQECDDKIAQIKAQKRKLLSREKEQERKARTKRLIEVGAVVESVLGEAIKKEDLSLLKSFLEQQETNGNYFSKAMNKTIK